MTQRKVLIVDDNDDTRLLLSLRLKNGNYDTAFATDVLEAVATARLWQPDIILLDLGLPGGNGFWVLEQLRHIPALRSVPIVIVSAEEPAWAKEKALALGASEYLQKPVSQEVLLSTVVHVLAERPISTKAVRSA